MSNYLGVANAFIVAQLKADPVLLAAVTHLNGSTTTVSLRGGALPEPIPGAEIYPAIVFSYLSGGLTLGMGGDHLLSEPLYLVRAIAKGGFGAVTNLANRIDACLHQQQATVTVDGITYDVCCLLEDEWQRQETPNNVEFAERGGKYRLFIQLF